VTGSEISHNSALVGFGGGIFSDGPGAIVSVAHSVVSGNSAFEGGGLDVGPGTSSFTVSRTSVTGNSAAAFGGGVLVETGVSLNLADSTVTGNSAAISGGGIYSEGSVIASGTNNVSGNTPDNCEPNNIIPGCT
jgi:predicted outer membrane repeat protein